MEALELSALGDVGDEAVLRHVDVCASCRDLVEEIRENNALLAKLQESCAGDDAAPVASALTPDAIDGYTIEGELHRGGQGVVYEATQIAAKRKVALKVLIAGALATSKQRARFEREIELVSGLRHPNIVTLYDSGETESGRRYLAMELVAGRPIDAHVDAESARGAMSRRELIALFAKVCSAVSEAHRHGVIHRDLKPGNILVDERGEPRVLDFGLATIAGEGAEGIGVTRSGEFLGTLAYASPEQTRGAPTSVDIRSDVYALGVLLYRLLSGRLPYDVEGSLATAVKSINESAPTRLRGKGGAFGVDDELETIVFRALSKEKGRRYQSAEALGEDLRRYLAGEAIDAKRDSRVYVLRKTVARHRMAAVFSCAFLVALIGFSATMSVLYQRAAREAEKTRQINVFLEDTLVSVEPAAGREPTIRETLDEAVHWVELALSDDPASAAAIRNTVGNSYRALGEYELAEAQLVEALRLRREAFGDRHVETARSLNSLGNLELARGNFGDAAVHFANALEIREESGGASALEIAQTMYNMARVELASGDPEAAAGLFELAGDLRGKALGSAHADVAMTVYQRARCMAALSRFNEALALDERALEMRRAALHPEHPDLQRSWLAVGDDYLTLDQPARAAEVVSACLRVRQRSLPAGHWRIGEALARLGECRVGQGETIEGRKLLLDGGALLLAGRGRDDPRTQRAVTALAELDRASDSE